MYSSPPLSRLPAPPPPPSQSPAEESLLQEVLHELDRERSRRAELEEKLRQYSAKEEMLEEVERNAASELADILEEKKSCGGQPTKIN